MTVEDATTRRPRRWWSKEDVEQERGQALVDTARAIEMSPGELMRSDLNLLYGSMYEGRQLTSLYQYGGPAAYSSSGVGAPEVTWNLIRSVIQTVASQVSRSRPRARFITTDGNSKQKRRAKKLTAYCDGLFRETELYDQTQLAFLDAAVFDIGAIEVYVDNGRIRVARVRACELLIDANEGIDGAPRSLYRRRFIDRDVARRKYGKTDAQRKAIEAAPSADPVGDGTSTNLIEIYEGWRLATEPKAKDGRHIVAVEGEGGTLVDEEWRRDYFPVILFRLDPALSGPYGRSAAEVLLPIQMAINTALDKIERAQHLAAVPRVGIPRGSKITVDKINNKIGSVIYFSGGTPPIWWSPTALSPEVYAQLERHYSRGFELYGVSRQLAGGQTAAGDAAIKVREDLDVQTARFATVAQRWEQLHMRCARVMIDFAREIYEDNKEMRVQAPGTALLESIDWQDVDLEEDQYVIQVYPTSLLPQTPQGRIDRVNELVTRGIWSSKRAEAALDDLDPDSHTNRERAPEKDIERVCEAILLDGKYEGPEPFMDLGACTRIAAQYVAEGRNDKAPAKHLDLLYRWMDDVQILKDLLAAKARAAAAPVAPSPGAPGAAPLPLAAQAAAA